MAIESLGEVESPVGTLRCTLRAWEEINAAFGSYTEAYRRVSALDASAFVSLLAIGTGREAKTVKADIFRAGMPALVKPLTHYLELLSNGGKPIADAPEGDESGEG